MTISNANISFDRTRAEEIGVVRQNTKITETQKQEILVFDEEVTFNRQRSLSQSEVIDNAKFRTTATFNSRTDCSPSGYAWRFVKSMHDKLIGG